MRTNIYLTELESCIKSFIIYVEQFEHIKSIRKKIQLEALNGLLTICVEGEYFEYSAVWDMYDDMAIKGFAYNPKR